MTQQVDVSYPLIRRRHSFDIFVCMLVVSLLLHLAASVIFLLPGRFAPRGPAPVFLDLQNLTEAPPPAGRRVAEEKVAETLPQNPLPEPAAVPEPEPVTEASKLEKAVENALQKAVQSPDAVHESGIGLGMLSGHFASFAEGVTLKDEIRVYYFLLMRRINEAWWTGSAPQGSFDHPAAVNLMISREGKLLGCELMESSGSLEQDRALLAAVKRAEPLPPLPRSYIWPTFNAPIRFVPPLRLMMPGFTGKGKMLLNHGK